MERGGGGRERGNRQAGYAVIGLGHIAQSAVLPAFAHAKNSRLVALVSSDEQKRERLGQKYKCAAYDPRDLDEALALPEVDAAYIAEPNDKHVDFAVRCARAGVHVLCEKPLAVSEEECRRMIAACREGGVKLMTAYRLHFEESNLAAVKLIEQGKIGEPRFFSSTFAYQVKPGNIRTSAERGGGAIWDLGVYCVNAARYLFRADPVEVFALRMDRHKDERFAEVHEGMTVLLKFPGERVAQLTVSFGAYQQDQYRLVGTKGHIEIEGAYEYAGPRELRLSVGGKEKVRKFKPADQFAPELVAFSRAILEDGKIEPDGEEGLRDVRIIVAALKSARENRPLTLSWPARKRRPEPSDRMYRPPVREPRLVEAEAPTQE
ncbi:MAG TPA: Gfo/Idh/MocA family oxidoreductase [Myxococcales bacterium]|nr:Gfo/Idh/MocA family oxidoreductase [Myxococcales bacterium]